MNQRGKFSALTMVNWNGFFARTFDIDTLVTTLSGGNGAGKSTTMAAFITALIPDQSLLHFRNTTEAGSSASSRDKGLHGKLKPGACYALLDVMNSQELRILCGVRLQQVAGRDKKVDIKPFIVQGLPQEVKPTDILVEHISLTQVRVRQLNEVKEAASKYDDVQIKLFNSVTEYHSYLFEYGILPKKLRNTGDRSKYYRLIEASLYGGISSAITKSLRDYLLPQNGGVKKAFQDMEVALRENRMTLEAIKLTQHDRDLFKHLIIESTHYVASDYMRIANERRRKLEAAMARRSELSNTTEQLMDFDKRFVGMNGELAQLDDKQALLEANYQAASDHLQLVQTAVRQQEKVDRYQDELEALAIRLEEQMLVVEEIGEKLMVAEEQDNTNEEEVDSLKTQLADYQQALNIQQTHALQYQQALDALEKAKEIMADPALTLEKSEKVLSKLRLQEEKQTTELLGLKHKLDLSKAAATQFEKGLALVARIVPDPSRDKLGELSRTLITKGRSFEHLLESGEQALAEHRELERQMRGYQQAKTLTDDYERLFAVSINNEQALAIEAECQQARMEAAELELSERRDKVLTLEQQKQDLDRQIKDLSALAPDWILANEALEGLTKQLDEPVTNSQQLLAAMQAVMVKERQLLNLRDKTKKEKDELDADIAALSHHGSHDEARLAALAETLGGTLLSEIYDDITVDDAPYFSALYGPARHAIVVPELDKIKEKVALIKDCPDDLYIIEGDVDGFDDSVFTAEEMEGAVYVQVSNRQVRYSRFPKLPLFGRAARDARLETLRQERERLTENHATLAFDAQKQQRLSQSISQFVSQYINIAFEPSPELGLKALRSQQNELLSEFAHLNQQEKQFKTELEKAKEALKKLQQLQHLVVLLEDDSLAARIEKSEQRLARLNEARDFLKVHQQTLGELLPLVPMLDADPKSQKALETAYQKADTQLQLIKKQVFSLADLLERKMHFSYFDALSLLDKSSELSEQLKVKLVLAEEKRALGRAGLKTTRDQMAQYNQVLASLKSAHQAKFDTLNEFKRELDQLGVRQELDVEDNARNQKEAIYQQLISSRQRKSELEKSSTTLELEIKSLTKQFNKTRKDYKELRKFVVNAKVGWMGVLKLSRESQVEKQLNRREMAYLSEQELRSLSDKSLGALRLAVADNESLRDALRASEDSAYPERKVLFYVAVYQHLRERIRQDIIQTDDPIEAIEEMEIELARLTDELTLREKRLAISSESVANIIRKTIQREQNRVRMLNQGLSNIAFGQVKGVRLNVTVRESHKSLLEGLAEQAEQHQDLFSNHKFSFSESMTKLYQRLNPHIDLGQRSAQVFGEELLDYRNYLELSIEVNRGTDGWMQAESGALSTGEAIGTGQAILLMVVQSWEEESRRLRSKEIVPCRLLFLDEAARLDAKSISTLFELCERLDMQLLIAAPENISPEQGTTYKLVRKIFNDKEHVHVVGLRGFSNNPNAPLTPSFDSKEDLTLSD